MHQHAEHGVCFKVQDKENIFPAQYESSTPEMSGRYFIKKTNDTLYSETKESCSMTFRDFM